MNIIDLSIIIVNYNTQQLTIDCINSVLDTVKQINFEIIVMDNSTNPDEVLSYDHPLVQCHTIPNKGYANANNLGYSHASGEYILLLNPDTIVYKESIETCLLKLKSNSNIGAIGCKVVRPDGSLDHACRRGFPTPFNSLCYFTKLHKVFKSSPKFCQYTMSHLSDTISCEVDSLTGAFMIMPRTVVEKTELFDETFFMYGEDLDLCFRIKELGYIIFYEASVSILHKKYQSGFAKRSPIVIQHFYNSMILFYEKHYKDNYNFLIGFAVKFSVLMIMYVKLFLNSFKSK